MGSGTDQRNALLLEYWPQGLLVIMYSIMSHVCLSSLARSLALLCFFLWRVFSFPPPWGCSLVLFIHVVVCCVTWMYYFIPSSARTSTAHARRHTDRGCFALFV